MDSMKALQILSSSVQADFNESFVTAFSSINKSCLGDSQWIPHKRFSSHFKQAIPSPSFDQQIPSDTYTILKLENNNSVEDRSWRQIGVYRNKGSTIQMEGNIIPVQLGPIPRITPKALRIVSIAHGQYLYKVGSVLGCEGAKLCTRQTLQRRSLQPSCEVGVPCYDHMHSEILNDTDELHIFCVSGLMIDLLGLIQNKLGFSYELYLVPDGKYGAIDDATGRWNGMIGEVLYGHADIALGTITINAQRSQVVDFTSPYGEVGIGMMISNGNTARPLITMEFLEPFGTSLWIAIVTTIFTILIALWFLDRKTSEFYSKSRRTFFRREKKYFQRRQSVTFLESMSYTWSTFVHVPAGSGFPRSLSARLVSIFFAFAMIILSSTYTANLAANKVKDEAESPITGIHDEKMVNPPAGFHFGTLKSTSTEAYFKFNRDPRMRKIYQNMKDHNVENVHDGVKKVKSGELSVYIDDQPYLEHMVSSQYDCSLRIVGKPFGISGYGLVLRKNSPWTQAISNSILQLSGDNVLAELWSKWLVRKCLKKEDFEKMPDRLSIHNYNGVFVLVAAGILISILFLGFERKIASYRAKTEGEIILGNFASTIAGMNSETEGNAKSMQGLNFSYSNPVLQHEECDNSEQDSNRLKFNSIC
ncbi:glutamate receptor ionotropic, NMDA 1-like [Oculina patagonica]